MKKGFTLIELLVVIAIIGLLASVVLVSMSGLQGKARITKALEFSQSLQRNLGAYAVGVWSFDDQTNPTKDGSGYNNNGTLTNGPTFTSDTPHSAAGVGTSKYAVSFDGLNDYVSVPNSVVLAITGAITIEAWVKTESTGTGQTILMRNGPYNFFLDGNNKLSFQVWTGTWSPGITGATVLSTGKWYHVVATYDLFYLRLYINGSPDGTPVSRTGAMSAGSETIFIGANSSGAYGPPTTYWFKGSIDEVRIYEKALTLGEIQKHYANGIEEHAVPTETRRL